MPIWIRPKEHLVHHFAFDSGQLHSYGKRLSKPENPTVKSTERIVPIIKEINSEVRISAFFNQTNEAMEDFPQHKEVWTLLIVLYRKLLLILRKKQQQTAMI